MDATQSVGGDRVTVGARLARDGDLTVDQFLVGVLELYWGYGTLWLWLWLWLWLLMLMLICF